jgi:hypothetical protein
MLVPAAVVQLLLATWVAASTGDAAKNEAVAAMCADLTLGQSTLSGAPSESFAKRIIGILLDACFRQPKPYQDATECNQRDCRT